MRVVVLYAVNQLRGVLQAHTHGNAFRFNGYVAVVQRTIDIACRVAGGQYHGVGCYFTFVGAYAADLSVGKEYLLHAGFEVYFAATFYYSFAHVLYHAWQLVGAYMRVRVR